VPRLNGLSLLPGSDILSRFEWTNPTLSAAECEGGDLRYITTPLARLLPLPAFLLGSRPRFSVVSLQQRHLI
jgi:hypothetical protein